MHRMTELFGRLAPGATLDAARAELRAAHAAMVKAHPEAYRDAGRLPHRREGAARRDHLAGADDPAGAAGGVRARLHRRVLERREPDPRAVGPARRRAGDSRRARRRHGRAAADAARRKRAPLWRPARCWRSRSRGRWSRCCRSTRRVSRCARTTSRSIRACSGSAADSRSPRRCCWRSCRGCRRRTSANGLGLSGGGVRLTSGTNRRLRVFAVTQIGASFVLRRRRRHADHDALRAAAPADRLPRQPAGGERAGRVLHAEAGGGRARSTRKRSAASRSCRASSAWRSGRSCRGAIRVSSPRSSRSRATARRTAKRIRARSSGPCRRASSARSA